MGRPPDRRAVVRRVRVNNVAADHRAASEADVGASGSERGRVFAERVRDFKFAVRKRETSLGAEQIGGGRGAVERFGNLGKLGALRRGGGEGRDGFVGDFRPGGDRVAQFGVGRDFETLVENRLTDRRAVPKAPVSADDNR